MRVLCFRHGQVRRRHRSGHDQHPLHRVRPQGAIVAVRAEGARSRSTRSRAGSSTIPLEIWRNTQEVIAAALQRAKLTAGDLAAVGITNQRETTCSGTGAPASRCTTRSSGRTRASIRSSRSIPARRRPGSLSREHRPAARQLLQRTEAALAARQRAGRARARRGRRAAVRHDRQLAAVESDRRRARRPARHRRDQCEPHAAHASRDAAMGRRAAGCVRDPALRCCRASLLRARSTAKRRRGRCAACRSPASSAISRRRSSGRPASSRARRRTPTAPAASC